MSRTRPSGTSSIGACRQKRRQKPPFDEHAFFALWQRLTVALLANARAHAQPPAHICTLNPVHIGDAPCAPRPPAACLMAGSGSGRAGDRNMRMKRELRAYVDAPPKQDDYRVTRMEPTRGGAEHAGVVREAADRRDGLRRVQAHGRMARNAGWRTRRSHMQSVRQMVSATRLRGARGAGAGAGLADGMPVSSAVETDLEHVAARQANSDGGAGGADAAYSPGGAVKVRDHPQRAADRADSELAAAEEDKKSRRKIERDAAIVGAWDKARTVDLLQI